jgi:hypothetical protein
MWRKVLPYLLVGAVALGFAWYSQYLADRLSLSEYKRTQALAVAEGYAKTAALASAELVRLNRQYAIVDSAYRARPVIYRPGVNDTVWIVKQGEGRVDTVASYVPPAVVKALRQCEFLVNSCAQRTSLLQIQVDNQTKRADTLQKALEDLALPEKRFLGFLKPPTCLAGGSAGVQPTEGWSPALVLGVACGFPF